MIQQTTSLLRSLWETSSQREEILATFECWVQNGVSRSEAQGKVKALIEALLAKQEGSQPLKIDLKQVQWGQITEFLCTCFYRKRLREPFPDVPSDTLWEKLTNAVSQAPLSPHPQQEKAINMEVSELRIQSDDGRNASPLPLQKG